MKKAFFILWMLTLVVNVLASEPAGEKAVNKHWNADPHLYANNMTMVGVIQLNGAEIQNESYEIGAFCGEECRGSEVLRYYATPDRYLVFMTVYGDENDAISFRLYDHENAYEFVEATASTVTFTVNAMHGMPSNPYVFDFTCPLHTVTCTPNAAVAGTVSGGGSFFYGKPCAVSATANPGFLFSGWAENGAMVSSQANYSFNVTASRDLVAVFQWPVTDTVADGCDAFTWHGHTYTASGVYRDTMVSSIGIDSIVDLHLTLHPPYHIDLYETACGVFYWDDEPLEASGDYVRQYESVYGCDSIETLHLTIIPIRPLGAFGYMSPANNYIVKRTDMDFYWSAVANASSYDFYFWEGDGGRPETPVLSNTNSFTYRVNNLSHGGVYHWCVVAKNECDEAESEVRTFTCQLDPMMTVVPRGTINFGEVELGQSNTKAISVSGVALTENISYAFLDNAWGQDAEFFQVTPSNWDVTGGGMLHVTFTPEPTQLYYNAAIRIASGAFADTVYFMGSVANRYVFTTEVEGEVYAANDNIEIHGHVEDILGQAVPDMNVNVYLMVMGGRFNLPAVSDANGDYSVTYVPRYSESGYYQVGSCLYGDYSTTVHDAFDIPGMGRVSGDFIIWTPYQDETLTGTIEIRNRSRIPISGIQVNTVSLPSGCSVEMGGVTDLGPLETGLLYYEVTGSEVSTGDSYEEVVINVTSDEGVSMNLTCYYYCRPRRGALEVYPSSVVTTARRGAQKVLSFQIANNGNGETGPITIGLPNVGWMSVMGDNILESLPAGDSCAFSILLSPNANVGLNQYSGTFAVNCSNGNGFSIPYQIEITADTTTRLVVDVTDDYTYNTNNGDGPHLAGANVSLTSYYSLDKVAEGMTDENGLFAVENVPEGYYYLSIHAESHKSYDGIIYVDASHSTRESRQEVYLQFQAITYSWVVVPTEIVDEYEFELVADIQVNVPVPVVTVDCPSKIDTLAYGDTIQFSMTVTNHGLVDAIDTQLTMPTEFPEYDFIPMFDFIDTLHAKTSVVIPCIVTRTRRDRTSLNDYHCHLGSGRTISGYYCNQEKKWVEFTFTIGFRVYCNYTGTDNPIVNFPHSTTSPSIPSSGVVVPSPSVGVAGGPGWSGWSGAGTVTAGNSVDNVTTTSQDCTPCWKMIDLQLNRMAGNLLDLIPKSQELLENTVTDSPSQAQIGDLSKIDPELQTLMRDSRDGSATFRVIVEMKEQYDNPYLERSTAMMTRAERRDYVVEELKRFSESSQAEVTRYLDAQAKRGGVNVLHHFWIFNGVCCEATASCIDELSMRNDVRFVSLDKEMELDEIERGGNDSSTPPEKGVQWHVSKVRADEVWNDPNLGYKGEGVVVAIIDTGVNYEHGDISNNMWSGCGWDFYDNDENPMDGNGHGSHVAGIVASSSDTYKAGVAPEATIMALKVFGDNHSEETPQGPSDDMLIRAVEYALAHGADVMNLSLGSVGVGGNASFRETFVNVKKAGIVACVCAGNDGDRLGEFPIPNNIWSPGNCPPPWHNPNQVSFSIGGASAVICVGNTKKNDKLNYDSSIGPATWMSIDGYKDYLYFPGSPDNSGLVRPDVSAPGTGIWSLAHNNNSLYCQKSGTSMATPCVAGIIALMLEANPNLTPVKIDSILETTAVPCENQQLKNNRYGAGRVDAYEAVTAARALIDSMPQRYHITIDQNPFSIIETVRGDGYYEYGETCTLQASPVEHFLHWKKNGEIVYENGVPASAEYSFEVTEDAHYIACFDESVVCYYVRISANLPKGVSKVTVNGVNFSNNGVSAYYVGQSCKVNLTSKPSYWFCGWVDGNEIVSWSPEYTFNVDGNTKLTAWLVPVPSYSGYGSGTVLAPPSLQDMESEASRLQSISDAINSCMLCNRDSTWEANLVAQLDQCSNFYQAILDIYTNLFQEEEWLEEENTAQFLENFYAVVDPEDRLVSQQATQQLIESTEFTSVNASVVQSFVDRWNRSVQYWNEGIYTVADLPEGYDSDFVQRDSTLLQPAEAACGYAVANGFNDFATMYYATLSDCSDLFLEHQSDVCAKISVSFKQKMTMTREAFEGTLKIANGHTTDPMQDIDVDIVIRDMDGVDRTDLFQVNVKSLSEITGVDGTGSLNAQTEGTVMFEMIPTIEAAPDTSKYYAFGGSFSFLDPFSGDVLTYPLFPVKLQVNPSPDLHVDYFISRNIISDDPLTEDTIEATEPAELAMMIRNVGAGDAKNVYLQSSQPQVIDNQNGLLIQFDMVGSAMNGEPRPLGLTDIPFGTIASHGAGIAEWYFTSTLLARVTSSTPHVIHNNSYGNPKLSLVTELHSHDLIHAVRAYGDLEDGINDFLVNETTDLTHTPDMIYFSHGGTSPVSEVVQASTNGSPFVLDGEVTLTMTPTSAGWNYVCVDDPAQGQLEIIACYRDDGQEIPLSNVWTTWATMLDEGAPTHENKLHLVDTLPSKQPVTYQLVYGNDLFSKITVTVNPVNCGQVTGAGYYMRGDTVTLHAVPSFGYEFDSWSEGNNVVSNDTVFSFVAGANRYLRANFYLSTNTMQQIHLYEGWNWFSSYITYDANTLPFVQEEIRNQSPNAIIKSQHSFAALENNDWEGTLNELENQDMYMIQVGNDLDFTLSGTIVRPSIFPITLYTGWTWVCYIANRMMSLEESLASLNPSEEDIIKSQYGFSVYNAASGEWLGNLTTLKPGEGYAYMNNGTANQTLIYPNSGMRVVEGTPEERHFSPDWHRFMSNMTLMVTLDASEFDLGKGSHEIAAFVGDDCRGSARVQEVNGQYIAFVTVGGEDGEEVTFRLFDVKGGEVYPEVAQEKLRYATDAVYGSLKEPFKLHFRGAGVDETEAMLRVSPNPVYAHGEVRLGLSTAEKVRVEIYSTLGVKVMSKETSDGRVVLSPAVVPGTYIMKVVSASGAGHYCKLIVE
jgi:subtilisin family serine protease